jgi:sugar O-acyltransferase (sialic acid O-acetyltransferase NeuD family)
MDGIVLYGVGSAVVVDVEESLARFGLSVSAAVQNVPGEVRLQDAAKLVESANISAEIKACPFIVPLFTPAFRQQAAREALAIGFTRAFTLIDPSAVQPRTLTNGQGVYVNCGCSLGAAAEFDDFVFVNRGSSLGHHVHLGRFVSVGPGVVIAGEVTVGRGSMIGAGAVVLPKLTIGVNSVIGAGSVITKNVPDHCLVLGNPARIVKTDIAGYRDASVT